MFQTNCGPLPFRHAAGLIDRLFAQREISVSLPPPWSFHGRVLGFKGAAPVVCQMYQVTRT